MRAGAGHRLERVHLPLHPFERLVEDSGHVAGQAAHAHLVSVSVRVSVRATVRVGVRVSVRARVRAKVRVRVRGCSSAPKPWRVLRPALVLVLA